MARQLRFHPLVASDISAAIDWYEGRSTGLGDDFRLAVDSEFDEVVKNPELFPRAFHDVDFRFARLRRFPYLVLYRVRKDTVLILGVLHSASDPAKWRRRARDS